MPTPGENVNAWQYFFMSGTATGYNGITTPISASQSVWLLVKKRPASRSNPVRKDGTRAYGSWNRTSCMQTRGYGTLNVSQAGSPWSRKVSGSLAFSAFPEVAISHADSLLNDARMKALGSLSDSKTQFNVAAVQAAGTVKTVSQFTQQASRGLVTAWDELRRGARQIGGRRPGRRELGELGNTPPIHWKDVPSGYLAYLYGLKPLADDIANGFDELGSLSKKEMSFGYSVRSTRLAEEPFEERIVLVGGDQTTGKHYCRGLRKMVGRVRYDYHFPKWWIDSVPVMTPFSEIWEGTRYSFVLDWILPVGDWIGAMQAAQFDPYFSAGWELRCVEEKVSGPVTRSENPFTTKFSLDVGDWDVRRYSMVREALTSEQRPAFRTTFPDFRNKLGIDHAAQGLSLMTQLFTTAPNSWRRNTR